MTPVNNNNDNNNNNNNKLGVVESNLSIFTTTFNMSQQGDQTHTTWCAQQRLR